MHINYVTNADLCNEIRRNLWKIPHDISGIICIPRGGLFCGSIIAEFLHVPIYTVNSFLRGEDLGSGKARSDMSINSSQKYLVVDDSVSTGSSLQEAYNALKGLGNFVFCVVVGENKPYIFKPDIILVQVPEFRLFEMNLFRSGWISRCILDIDGVLCKDPEPGIDMDENLYLNHLNNTPSLIPLTYQALALCTHRLIKYAKETTEWLQKNNIYYRMLYMLDLPSIEEKLKLINSPIVLNMKANVYNNEKDAILFIESSWPESQHIYNMTHKPVLCLDRNIVLQD